jgi:signal transduction histidine kinase
VDWAESGIILPKDVNTETRFSVTSSRAIRITIRDNGLGIAEDDMHLIFDEGRYMLL